jgi:hypothetical protein
MSASRFDVVIVGGGPAGLSAALMLGRCRRRVAVCDDDQPRNAASKAAHGLFTRDGENPRELLRIGRAQLLSYSVELLDRPARPRAEVATNAHVHTSTRMRDHADMVTANTAHSVRTKGTTLRKLLRENGLSLALGAMFVASAVGQAIAGHGQYNQELEQHGRPSVSVAAYLRSGHFLEAFFENWESEFLQMGVFVLLAAKLKQKGSAESKSLDQADDVDADPRDHRADPNAPGPVRRGGLALTLYEHSLSSALFLLFVLSFALHAVQGLRLVNAEEAMHGRPGMSLGAYVTSNQFWFESLQNWQSEFVAVLAVVVLSIHLRERGSPQSKPVAAPHAETGK